VDGLTKKTGHRTRGSSLASAASSIRSVGVYRGRGTCRRSTASWWRNTAISTASASGVGPQPSTPSTRRTIINATVRTTTTATLPDLHHRRSHPVSLRWHPSRFTIDARGLTVGTTLDNVTGVLGWSALRAPATVS
jgi:hypothetical protein